VCFEGVRGSERVLGDESHPDAALNIHFHAIRGEYTRGTDNVKKKAVGEMNLASI
jgi:hypothetical protein